MSDFNAGINYPNKLVKCLSQLKSHRERAWEKYRLESLTNAIQPLLDSLNDEVFLTDNGLEGVAKQLQRDLTDCQDGKRDLQPLLDQYSPYTNESPLPGLLWSLEELLVRHDRFDDPEVDRQRDELRRWQVRLDEEGTPIDSPDTPYAIFRNNPYAAPESAWKTTPWKTACLRLEGEDPICSESNLSMYLAFIESRICPESFTGTHRDVHQTIESLSRNTEFIETFIEHMRNKYPDLARDDSWPMTLPEKRLTGNWESVALAHLLKNPKAKIEDLAAVSGVHRNTIGKSERIRQAREAIRSSKSDIPRGSKTAQGQLEAYD